MIETLHWLGILIRAALRELREARISKCKAARVRKEVQRALKAETNRLNIGARVYQRNRANIN
jgi:hypothetical protein